MLHRIHAFIMGTVFNYHCTDTGDQVRVCVGLMEREERKKKRKHSNKRQTLSALCEHRQAIIATSHAIGQTSRGKDRNYPTVRLSNQSSKRYIKPRTLLIPQNTDQNLCFGSSLRFYEGEDHS